MKNFTISDIDLGRFGEGKIFIRESLNAKRRKLFKHAESSDWKKKYHNFKYISTYYGTIYLRKDGSIVWLCELLQLRIRKS